MLPLASAAGAVYLSHMRVIRDYQFVDPNDKGASVAIGNFDGVHLGHQSVIDLARDGAKRHDAPLGI